MVIAVLNLIISAAILITMIFMHRASVRDRKAADKRREILRKNLDNHFPAFEEALGHQIWDQTMEIPSASNVHEEAAERLERKALLAKIKRDFIENLIPNNEKERSKLSIAVERYERSIWKHVSNVDGAGADLTFSGASPDQEKIVSEDFAEQRKVFKTELYHDMLYKDD